jgi:hypothetical protein
LPIFGEDYSNLRRAVWAIGDLAGLYGEGKTDGLRGECCSHRFKKANWLSPIDPGRTGLKRKLGIQEWMF